MSFDLSIKESNKIKGVYIIKPSVSFDSRGNIWTSFMSNEIEYLLPEELKFKHDKFSKSSNNVLRGIHGDNKSWKLVTCVSGSILQVVVDLRENSSTYNDFESFEINEQDIKSILIPPSMGNAYYVKSKDAVYHYKLAYNGDYIDADEQFSYKWDNPNFNIDWPTKNPILSGRDK